MKHRKALIEAGLLPPAMRSVVLEDDSFFPCSPKAVAFFKMLDRHPDLKGFFRFKFARTAFDAGRATLQTRAGPGRLDNRLLDLLTKVRTRRVAIGTDGFTDDVLNYLHKGKYSLDMAWQLMRGLDRRGIRQLHFIILTNPQMSLAQLKGVLVNCRKALNTFPTLELSFNPRLMAVEGTGLMPEIPGEDIYLPVGLPLDDPAMEHMVRDLFARHWESLCRHLKEGGVKKKQLKKFRAIEAGELRRLSKRNFSLGEALLGITNRYLLWWTIDQLLAGLGEVSE